MTENSIKTVLALALDRNNTAGARHPLRHLFIAMFWANQRIGLFLQSGAGL